MGITRAPALVRAALVVVVALALPVTKAGAQSIADRLAIHAYLTQGYAATDSHQVIGIPRGGTFDYRRAAVLLRFQGTAKDAFVLQFANRRLGESPTNAFTPDVQLDWAFYERQLGKYTKLRIGKLPIPIGLFNETRYVGTLLPFYRAPYGFYEEGTYTSETLSGLELTRELTPNEPWKLTASVFGGSYNYLQAGTIQSAPPAQPQYLVTRATAKNVLGAQLWLQTPITGLRVGLGGDRRDDYGTIYGTSSDTHGTKDWWTSAEGRFDRFTVRSEYREFYINAGASRIRTYYGQAGYRILDALTLNVQHDALDVRYSIPGGELALPFIRDDGGGADYAFAGNMVAKLEYHRSRGYSAEEVVNYYGSPVHSNYVIASVSVSF